MENALAALQGASEEEQQSDTYEVDKLLELIRIQQSKIQELQGTLRILSMNG
jgi:hypothetical protein